MPSIARGLIVVVAAGLVGVASPSTTASVPPGPQVERIAGVNRYATAANLSSTFFDPGVAVAYVATGEAFPDALTAGPAATVAGGPVILTKRDVLPAETAAELQRLRPYRIVVVGGRAVVSETVVAALDALHGGGGVERVAGPDRYATAAAISARAFQPGVVAAYVTTGEAFPDALSGGTAAAASRAPVLLVERDRIPVATSSELRRLRPGSVVVVGGTAAVSASVARQLEEYTEGAVRRLAGPDRYQTAIAVSKDGWATAPLLFVASGRNFPDATAGVAAAGARGAPLLLVPGFVEPPLVDQEIARLAPRTVYVLGGPTVIAPLRWCRAGVRPAAGTQQVFHSIPGTATQVALTFDMGGRLDPAVDIVRFLVDQQVCATLFLSGWPIDTPAGKEVAALVRAHPDLIEVGNHTLRHCNLRDGGGGMRGCPSGVPSAAFIQQELLDAAAVIRAATGQDPAPFWRPPYGAYDQRVLDAAAEAGYTKTFMWNVDSVDWLPVSDGGPTAAEIIRRVVDRSEPGSVVLFHLGGWNTLDALPTVVYRLRLRGFDLTAVSDMLR